MRGALSKVWSTAVILFGFFTLAGYQNCGAQNQAANTAFLTQNTSMNLVGTVQKSTLDGCKYIISVPDGSGQTQNYVPVGLDPSLQKDGVQISMNGVLLSNSVSVCMAGPLIQVQEAHSL